MNDKPLSHRLIESKIVWITAIIISIIFSIFEITMPSRIVGAICIFTLLGSIGASNSNDDPKGWAIVYLVGIISAMEFGGMNFF